MLDRMYKEHPKAGAGRARNARLKDPHADGFLFVTASTIGASSPG